MDDGRRRIELALSNTLLYGVLASTCVIVVGLVLMTATNSTGYACDLSGDSSACLLSFNALSSQLYPTSVGAISSGLLTAKPFAIIQLGVLVLLATPVLRVSASLVLFAAEKDKAFVLITLFVLMVLLFSFFIVPTISLFRA
ncbi:MAG: DUF1634 domain-containing protein [Nitrososphaerales archaeon]